MISSAHASWADGIATPVYEMLDRGASNDDIDRYLRARQGGDVELARRIHSEAGRSPRLRASSRLDSSAAIASRDITVAALRPVVNELTAQELQYYVYFVKRASELLVETHDEESIWASPTVVEAAGSSLGQSALNWLRSR